MIRLGLIGCGQHAEVGHAISLARYKAAHGHEIELAAACDVRKERAQYFCQKYGFASAYGNAVEMLKNASLDGCIAVVPPEMISEIGIMLLSRGIACSVEKPLGACRRDVSLLLDAAKQTLTSNMVSVNRRFMPYLNCAMEWAKTIGPLRYIRGTMTRNARSEPEFIWTTAVHAVDALRHIAGEVSQASLRVMKSGNSASWHIIDLRFENGIYGHIDVLPTSGALEETYELYGEGFRATVTCPFGRERALRCFRDNNLVLEKVAGADAAEDALHGFYDEATEFIRALRNKQKPRPSIEDVFPSVELCFMMANSSQENQVILHGH